MQGKEHNVFYSKFRVNSYDYGLVHEKTLPALNTD